MDEHTPGRHPAPQTMNALRDGTYRAMLRLEAGKRDAASSLCNALLTAWHAGSSVDKPERFGEWLRKITPFCLGLLSASTGCGNIQGCGPHRSASGKTLAERQK